MTIRPSVALPAVAAGVGAWLVAGPGPGVAAAVLAAAGAVGAAYLDDRYAMRDLDEVAGILRGWTEGDFRARLRWARMGSLGRLADATNQTARALADRTASEAATRERLETMLGALDVGVVYTTEARRVVAMNHAAEALFALDLDKAVGHALVEVVPDPELDRVAEDCLRTGVAAAAEFDVGPGVQRVLRYRLAPTRDASGRTTGLLIVVSDLTHERRLERVRQDFIENVTHELQTPLTSIRGFAETLAGEAGADGARRGRYLGIVEREAERLSSLVADLLELSRWEGKRPPLRAAAFDLGEVLSELVTVYRPVIEGRGLALVVEVPAGPLPITADREAAARVVRNLLDNAIKYTQTGAITLRLFRIGRTYRLEVEDTGMGLPAAAIPRVFERFYRVDKGRDRESGGTGLGLAIVRHLVEAHGGRVRAHSDGLGLGSRFVVEWPAAPSGRDLDAQGLGQDEQAGEGEEDARHQLGPLADARPQALAEGQAQHGEEEAGGGDDGDRHRRGGAQEGEGEADGQRVHAHREG